MDKNCGTCKISTLCVGEDLHTVVVENLWYCVHCEAVIVYNSISSNAFYTKKRGVLKELCSDMQDVLRGKSYINPARCVCKSIPCNEAEEVLREEKRERRAKESKARGKAWWNRNG